MSAIWRHDGTAWSLLSPAGFPDEAALHRLVEEAPHLLPLSGTSTLVVLGREVGLGGGFADLVAVEAEGRMVVIEVKLARNAEARRAVVSQVLAYAAYLHGLSVDELEREVLRGHLRQRGHVTIADAISAADQRGAFDAASFNDALASNLESGEFRLVLVLDDAPPELIRLVGYLEAVGGGLVIDLITVTAYDVDGSRVLVPQRVDPERPLVNHEARSAARERTKGFLTPGADAFVGAIESLPSERQGAVRRLASWANDCERDGLITLHTYHGKDGEVKTLLPYLPDEQVGLITIWLDGGVSLWRTVFERRAPRSIAPLEEMLDKRIGNGNNARDLSDRALFTLAQAYRDATGTNGGQALGEP